MKSIREWLMQWDIEPNSMTLYEEACTHSSFANEANRPTKDNERLEFVGDAVLQLWSAYSLYNLDPPLKEGKMTTLRSQVVCEKALAAANKELGWNQYLKLGHGEEKSGGRNRNSLLADQFEAVMGALYLDKGYEAAFGLLDIVLLPMILEKLREDERDYKTQLQEYCQSDRSSIQYRMIKEEGPSNQKTFTIGVYVDDILMGVGVASSKKKAEQQAAQEAFLKLA